MTLDPHDAVFRRARLTDVPFIFELLIDGSLHGSFSDDFLTARGHVRLLLYVLRMVGRPVAFVASSGFPRGSVVSTFVLESTGRSLGFFNSTRWIGATSRHYAVITDCAVAAESRGSGLGGLMIRRYLESLPGDTEVIVHCTKYARAMQATLKKLRFRRQPEAGRLECYRFVRPSSFAAASDAVPPTPRQGFGKLRAHR